MEVLSVASEDEDENHPVSQPGQMDVVETPPPVLTIGSVLDKLSKIKSGNYLGIPHSKKKIN